jgi:copper(I)-binding protein
MRRLDALDLPAGHVVRLEPGGAHLMLMGLKQPLTVGQRVRLSFTVEDAAGRRSVEAVDAPVLQAPPQEEKE